LRRNVKIPLLVVGGLVAAILLVWGGLLLGLNPEVRGALRDLLPGSFFGSSGSVEDFELQQEVLEKLESTYYRPVDASALEGDAVDGMVAGLGDPYTVYMDPEDYADFREQSEGSYSGVGMTVEMKDSLVTIVSTFKGSPAEQAGIRSGDIILAVGGVTTDGLNLDEVVSMIKGPEGSTVDMSTYRPPATTTTTVAGGAGEDSGEETGDTAGTATVDLAQLPPGGEKKEYTLTRKTIEVPVTERETLDAQGKRVALISFFTFSDGSADQLRAEVAQAVDTQHAYAIILDLRSNGGGLLDEGVDVASIFISKGVIVTTEGLHSPEQVYEATGEAYADVPLYVLVDPYTASASEIVAGALQDYKRATLVGETTFGKGLVQSIEPLSNGGALKATTAVYLTPKGRDINKTGITPDIVAPDDPETTTVDECVETALGLIAGPTAAR
jgi:carboxyl-terminal processing protease